MEKEYNITDELIAAFMEGNATPKETRMVMDAVASDDDLRRILRLSMEVDDDLEGAYMQQPASNIPLPMLERAADNAVDNLCAIQCEGYILRKLGTDIDNQELTHQSEEKGWLKHDGIPLHRIGQLSSLYGLFVSHRYDCSVKDIDEALRNDGGAIAVIDGTELYQSQQESDDNDRNSGLTPNHAVVITSITENTVFLFDPSSPNGIIERPLELFVNAWEDSSHYLVIISNQNNYEPHPLNLDNVSLETDLDELREAIAENAHEVWAKARKDEGWTYGPVRDDNKKQHPDMIPYNLLPESEKEYDRQMAVNTIKLLKKLGFEIIKKN